MTESDGLEPLFDLHSNLVGWMLPGRHVFDRAMNWIAYVSDGEAWSAATGDWIGPVSALACFDREGRVVAATPHQPLRLDRRPSRPPRRAPAPPPPRPARPPIPPRPPLAATPPGGWSRLRLVDWAAEEG